MVSSIIPKPYLDVHLPPDKQISEIQLSVSFELAVPRKNKFSDHHNLLSVICLAESPAYVQQPTSFPGISAAARRRGWPILCGSSRVSLHEQIL